MQLVGIGFNPSFWRFLLQRLEKHTGHGPLVGTLLDPSYLQPDRLVSTCAHLQDLQPVFTFFTPHGFREHRDCIFFLSQMQARLREVPLALVLENIQEELSPFLPPSPWVRLTNQMHFRVSHPGVFLTQKLRSFPWINLQSRVSMLEYVDPREGWCRRTVQDLPPQTLLALDQIRFLEADDRTQSVQEWLTTFLAQQAKSVEAQQVKGLLRTDKGLFLFPGVPLDGVIEFSLGDVKIKTILVHRQLFDHSAAFRRTLQYLETHAKRQQPIAPRPQALRCLGSLPILNELARSILATRGFNNVESVESLQPGQHQLGNDLQGFYLRTLPSVELKGNVIDLRKAINGLLEPVLDFVEWPTVEVPKTIASTPMQRKELDERREKLLREDEKLRQEQQRLRAHQELYDQEQQVLDRVAIVGRQLVEQLGRSLPWEEVAQNPAEFTGRQVLLWCEEEEIVAEMMRSLGNVPKRLWVNPNDYRESDDLLRLDINTYCSYAQDGNWVVTTHSRQHLEQLVSVIFTEQQRVQAINRQREQALEGIERSLQQLQQRKEQLALHWLYVSLQQTLSPHLTN